MPPLTRWYIKTALVYFVLALAAGVALLAPPVLGQSVLAGLQPVYLHLFMIGWVSELIFGVVYWMFPRYSPARPRGNERLAWAGYVLLNAGLVLRAVSEPWWAQTSAPAAGAALAVSAVLLWLGGAGFVLNTWARVKEK